MREVETKSFIERVYMFPFYTAVFTMFMGVIGIVVMVLYDTWSTQPEDFVSKVWNTFIVLFLVPFFAQLGLHFVLYTVADKKYEKRVGITHSFGYSLDWGK